MTSHLTKRSDKMKIRLTCIALSIAVVAAMFSMTSFAQEKKGAAAAKENIQGTVQNMSKETSTITVRVGTGGTATRQVVYDAKTKFLYGHSDNSKPGALAQVKDSFYISCAGTFNAKNQLMAQECVYRETR
jgi:hypothetical protein